MSNLFATLPLCQRLKSFLFSTLLQLLSTRGGELLGTALLKDNKMAMLMENSFTSYIDAAEKINIDANNTMYSISEDLASNLWLWFGIVAGYVVLVVQPVIPSSLVAHVRDLSFFLKSQHHCRCVLRIVRPKYVHAV